MGRDSDWTSKYLGSDHHTDRYVATVVRYEDKTGLSHQGNRAWVGAVSCVALLRYVKDSEVFHQRDGSGCVSDLHEC